MSPTPFNYVNAKKDVDTETILVPPHVKNPTSQISVNSPPISPKTVSFLCHPISRFFVKLRFEIGCFSVMFSLIVFQSSSTAMILEKTCLSNYSEDICGNLKNYTEIKSSVEHDAVNNELIYTLILTVPGIIVSLFVGPWSDKYGRKLPLQVALLGAIINAFGSSICAYYLHSKVEYYFIPVLFMGCTGGTASILTILYSFVSESVASEDRTMKNALFEIAMGLGRPVGIMTGGLVYKFFGYVAVFMVGACGLVFTLVWITFMIPETRGLDNKDPWFVKLNQFKSCKNFQGCFTLKIKDESQSRKKKVVLLIISLCILRVSSSVSIGTADINYMYAHHQFNWSNTMYSTVSSSYLVLIIVSLMVIMVFLRRINASDTTIGLIGIISSFARLVGIGIAWKPIVYHIANVLGVLQGCGPIAGRSYRSKIVSNEDLGKVFSLVAITETMFPVVTMIVFSQIFNAFLDIFPGTPFILLAAIIFIPFSIFIWLSCKPKENYQDIPGKNERNRENVATISKI